MVAPSRLQTNAYRVLRISASSTLSEIYRTVPSMSRAASLGLAIMTEGDLPALGEIIRTKASIRAAQGQLLNPRLRLQNRLFWFHGSVYPENSAPRQQSLEPPQTLGPVEIAHDDALRELIAAYLAGPGGTVGIGSALREWYHFVSAPEYWDSLNRMESDGGFEPAAIASEIESLRAEAVALAAEPFEIAARDAWVRKDMEGLRRYIAALRDLEDTGRWTQLSRKGLLTPLTDQFGDACSTLKNKYRSQMVYDNDAAERNKNVCIGELQFYRSFIEPGWKYLAAILPDDDPESRISRGQIAECLSSIAIDHTWADDFIVSQELAQEAIKLAQDTVVAERLQAVLRTILTRAFREILVSFDKKFALSIVHESDAVEQNKAICTKEVQFYRELIEPELEKLLTIPAQGDEYVLDSREAAANCLSRIATHHTWADEFIVAEGLMEESFKLARGTEAALGIHDKLLKIRESASNERLYKDLKPVLSAPSLRTTNNIGFKLYGHSDYDQQSDSFATTHYFVFLSLPLFPVGRYRVIQKQGTGSYRFLGKLPFRKNEHWHLGIALAVVAIMILVGTVNSNTPASSSEPYTPTSASTPYSDVTPQAPSADNGSSEPQPKDESPNVDYSVTPVKQRVDEIRTRLDTLEAGIQSGREEIDGLDRKMKPLHDEIESLKGEGTSGIQVDAYTYNSKVDMYNSLLRRKRVVISEVNDNVQVHNQLVDEHNSRINRH